MGSLVYLINYLFITHEAAKHIQMKCFAANLLKNPTLKKIENRLRISRVTAVNLVSPFLEFGVLTYLHTYIQICIHRVAVT